MSTIICDHNVQDPGGFFNIAEVIRSYKSKELKNNDKYDINAS